MKRLTGRLEHPVSPGAVTVRGRRLGEAYFENVADYQDYADALDKLAAYEDAEEQGRLIVLPCKVGSAIYAPTRNFVSEFRVTQFDYCGYEKPYLWVNWYLVKGITGEYRSDGISAVEIGKTVFLSRNEAEMALEGMR